MSEESQIKKLSNVNTFWEDVRKIVGYYENRFHEDWEIKKLQRIADARYAELGGK